MTNPYAAPTANPDSVPSASGAITGAMLDALRATKGWVKLVGIMMFIGATFTVFGALAMTLGAGMGGSAKGVPFAGFALIALIYLVMAVIYVFLGLHLVKYAGAINRLLRDGHTQSMEEALQHQQKFWRLAGIMALVVIGFGVLGIVAAIAIPMMAR